MQVLANDPTELQSILCDMDQLQDYMNLTSEDRVTMDSLSEIICPQNVSSVIESFRSLVMIADIQQQVLYSQVT